MADYSGKATDLGESGGDEFESNHNNDQQQFRGDFENYLHKKGGQTSYGLGFANFWKIIVDIIGLKL